jgi:hypothetical protein
MSIKKILTIDGGGIKGVFPASFLASIEEEIDGNISEYFDLIVGTSTGGIIALALGLGIPAKEILEFYEKNGPKIFKGNRLINFFKKFVLTKYTSKELKNALDSMFGSIKLGESKNRLVIPSFNLDTGEVYVYKTAHHARFLKDYKELAVHVALATSAAPTFFPAHYTSSGIPLVDGGLWANNPMGVATVEAIGVLEWPKDSIKILSIGCTTEAFKTQHGGGQISWVPKIADIFMASQSSSSKGTAQLLIGDENVKRVDPIVPTGKFGLDTIKKIKSLKALGNSEARKEFKNISEFFCNKVDPFIPVHKLSK